MPPWVSRVLVKARKASWGQVLAAIVWLRGTGKRYWRRLTPEERLEVLDVARKSRGRKANVTKEEEKRVAALLKKVEKEPVGAAKP